MDEDSEEEDELNLETAIPANNSAVVLNFDSHMVPESIHAEISQDMVNWVAAKTLGHVVHDLTPGKTYYFRVVGRRGVSNVVSSTLPEMNSNSTMCEYKGKSYNIGIMNCINFKS